MSYEKQTWNKYDDLKTEEENIANGAVVTDNRMNHIEEGIYSHTIDISNPHKVTAAQVGLDKVINVKQASKVEFDSHTSNNSNPHKVTAAQIGLDKVDNIQQAAKTDFDSHVNNKANPHAVTASQVGAYTKTESDSKLTDLSNKVIANKGGLASGTDLDNVIDIGTYRIGGLTGGTDIINVPSERSGTTIYAYLTVSGTTTSVVQELIVYDSKTVSQIYSRSRSGSTPTLSPWSKTVMADDSGKVTVKALEITNTLKRKEVSKSFPFGYGIQATAERVGEFITLTISGNNSAGAIPSGKLMDETIPVGYRPRGNYSLNVACSNQAFAAFLITYDEKITYVGNTVAINGNFRATISYITGNDFPAS